MNVMVPSPLLHLGMPSIVARTFWPAWNRADVLLVDLRLHPHFRVIDDAHDFRHGRDSGTLNDGFVFNMPRRRTADRDGLRRTIGLCDRIDVLLSDALHNRSFLCRALTRTNNPVPSSLSFDALTVASVPARPIAGSGLYKSNSAARRHGHACRPDPGIHSFSIQPPTLRSMSYMPGSGSLNMPTARIVRCSGPRMIFAVLTPMFCTTTGSMLTITPPVPANAPHAPRASAMWQIGQNPWMRSWNHLQVASRSARVMLDAGAHPISAFDGALATPDDSLLTCDDATVSRQCGKR